MQGLAGAFSKYSISTTSNIGYMSAGCRQFVDVDLTPLFPVYSSQPPHNGTADLIQNLIPKLYGIISSPENLQIL